jgi:hypothetical protein
MGDVRFRLFLSHDGADILQEIDATLLTVAPVPLFVAAGRALVAQRGMAPRAESRDIPRLASAFGAFHNAILPRLDAATRPA